MTAVDRHSPNSLKRLLGRVNSMTFKDEMGEVEYFGQRVLMLRKDVFRLLRDELEKRHAVGTGRIILGILGRSEGREEGRTLMADVLLDSADRRSIPIFVKNAVEEANLGYGKLRVGGLDISTKSVTVSTDNSVETDTTNKSEEAGCFFLLGYLEGMFSEVLGSPVVGNETTCRGRGDPTCTFQIAPGFPASKWKL